MWVLHSQPRKPVKYLGMRCGYYGGTMLQNVVLTNMDANIAWVTKKINKRFGRLMRVLWDEIIIECNMKYSYVSRIACSNKHYVYY